MCAGSCWRDQSRVRDETRRPSGQSDPQVCIQPTLSPWKQTDGRKTGDLQFQPDISISLLFCSFLLNKEETVSSWFPSTERSKVRVGYSPAAGDESSHLPLQCVKRRSMLWRVRKVKLSRGNSTLDGWGMGSHSRVVTLAAGGDKEPPPNGRMWPVQWRTWRNRGGSLKTERFLVLDTPTVAFLAKCTQEISDLRLHSPKFQISVCVKFCLR